MPALFFPNLDTLRLVLASGILPSEMTDAPASASIDEQGRLLLAPSAYPSRELLTGLARLGVRLSALSGSHPIAATCWAELLPLRPDRTPPYASPHVVLFVITDSALSRFVASLRGQPNCALGISFLPNGQVWVTAERPSLGVVLQTLEPDSGIEAYREQISNVWVKIGWEHPLPGRLVVPTSHTLLLSPGPARVTVSAIPPVPRRDEFFLTPFVNTYAHACVVEPVSIPLRLVRRPKPVRESLWVYAPQDERAFWDFCHSADERLIRKFEVTVLERGAERRIVVRGTAGKHRAPMLVAPARAFAADSRAERLYLPQGWRLQPEPRLQELMKHFCLMHDRLAWIEADSDGRWIPHYAHLSAFRPLHEFVTYAQPRTVSLQADGILTELFPFERFAVRDEVVIGDQSNQMPPATAEFEHTESPPPRQSGWVSRSLEKIAERFRRSGSKPTQPAIGPPQPPANTSARGKSSGRVERKLSSADELLHGSDRTSRRQALEAELLTVFPSLLPEQRAKRWAELGAIYGSTTNPMDAAICWMNAAWEADTPPRPWLEQWFVAECRAAKLSERQITIDRVMSEPGRFGMGRVLASYVVWAASQVPPPAEFQEALSRISAFLDHHFDDLPARAAWLARLSLARHTNGDALSLGRGRDRILHRLRERGPGLDLDEPSFLRFHGTASPIRFQIAREWLAKSRGPILSWVAKLGTSGRLQWSGLDPEIDCTGAYAQLMLAWGLGYLGERTRSRDWTARARKVLTRAVGLGVDPAVHTVLTEALAHRIRDAQEGTIPKPGLPAEINARYHQLSGFSRYAVDKMRRFSRILEPIDRVREYRGQEFREFWGHDLLGERLLVLADRTEPTSLADEVKDLLTTCAVNPSSTNIPRVAFSLLEVAAHVERGVIPEILSLVVPALEWMESWIQTGRWSQNEATDALVRHSARLLEGAFVTAARFNQLESIRPIADYLVQRIHGNPPLRSALVGVSKTAFRSLRKLGYGSEAIQLLRTLDPGSVESRRQADFPPSRLGMAIGWFAVGDEDEGNHLLNEARDQLFLAGGIDDRIRTELAIAYATALGFASPGIALGRLEELFQRLERVTLTGSTNRYFTLKPLELIDTVVRAVVTEEFALGPAVRGWMDDDEYLIRRRIHRDMSSVLRDECIS